MAVWLKVLYRYAVSVLTFDIIDIDSALLLYIQFIKTQNMEAGAL